MIAVAIPRPELGARAEARTKEIERCLKMNPTFIFMIDLDQTIPNRGFAAMLNGNGADISIIDAPNKGINDSNVKYHPDGTLAYATISCCLIRSTVFDHISKPWFSSEYAWVEEGVENGKIKWRIDKKHSDDNIGEDIYFIRKIIDSGLTIAIVPELKSSHFDLNSL